MNGGRALSAAIVVGVMLAVAHPAGAAATRETAEATVPDLPNPPEIRSRHGVLDAVFLTEPGKVTVATERFTSNVYNDLYIPPTLRVRRGDTLLLRLVNRIGPADVEITRQAADQHPFPRHGREPQAPGRQRVHQCRPGQELPVSGRNPERPSAGPALVPLAPARVRRPADPVRPVGHADRRRRPREPLPRARQTSAAGHGAQGHQPARRQRADADRQRPGQPADPQPPGRAPGLGDRQSGRRQLLRPQAGGAPVLGARARRQLPAPAAAAGYAVPAARRPHAGGRRGRRARPLLLPDHGRRYRPHRAAEPARAARDLRGRRAARERWRARASAWSGRPPTSTRSASPARNCATCPSPGGGPSPSPTRPTSRHSSSTTRPTTRTGSIPGSVSATSRSGPSATRPASCTSSTFTRPRSW